MLFIKILNKETINHFTEGEKILKMIVNQGIQLVLWEGNRHGENVDYVGLQLEIPIQHIRGYHL